MRKVRFTEHHNIAILKSVEAVDIEKIKDLEDENRPLKQMFADLSLENQALKDVIAMQDSNSLSTGHAM